MHLIMIYNKYRIQFKKDVGSIIGSITAQMYKAE